MDWGRRIALILAVAVLAPYVSPAAAGQIQRYTDGRGTVHITNVTRAQPTPVTFQEAPPGLPESPAAAPLPDHPSPATATASATAPEPGPPPMHLQKVAWSPPDCSPEEPLSGVSSSRAAPAGAGVIRSYRDSRGILHIDNGTPASPEPRPHSLLLAEDRRGAGKGGGEGPGGLPENPRPGLRKVSWNPEDRGPPGPLNRDTALQTPLPGVVRGYRDSRGIIHITNASPEGREVAPRTAIAALEPPAIPRALGLNGARPQEKGEDQGKLPLKPASWCGGQALFRAPPPVAPPSQSLAFTGDTIRRYRDKNGVWHIESVQPLGPEIRQFLAVGAGETTPALTAPVYANASLQGSVSLQAQGEMEVRKPPPSDPLGSQVVAFKDRLGRLHICNPVPPGQAERAPPLAAAALQAIILEAAQSYRLPVPLIQALIKAESNFVNWAVSSKGAMGLMQLMPDTASFLGVTDPFCPRQNIQAGCRYFRLLLDFFGDCLPLALAAYNAGFQRVVVAGYRVPAIKETQEFVTQVLERYYSAIAGVRRASASGGAAGPGRSPFT
jgi:soluble lytic murein transglycosylase-like protein